MKVCKSVTVTAMTPKGQECFFGYYDKCPWNASGRYLLAHASGFALRSPGPEDRVTVGLVATGRPGVLEPVAQTRAWNWQQGAMLQWWGGDPENTVLFNDRRDDRFVCVCHEIQSGKERVLPRPVAAVSRDGRWGLSLNFSRLADERPGYGYAGIADPFRDEPEPENDGLFLMDMLSGESRLIISTAQVARINRVPSMAGVKHRFNHLLVSPDGRRFIFLHRWRPSGETEDITRMYTANLDGTDAFCLNDHEMTGHFDWFGGDRVLAFARRPGMGDRYFVFTDKSREVRMIGGELLNAYNGHCSMSPDGQWLMTDSYPDKEGLGHLLLYHLKEERLIDLGAFHSPFWNVTTGGDEFRCDFHPRWSADGQCICFDSTHEGCRRVYCSQITDILRCCL